MKAYWDSSAVIEACNSPGLRARLHHERGWTRTHTLAEVFSTLTGATWRSAWMQTQPRKRLPILATDSDFHDLIATDVLTALKEARKKRSSWRAHPRLSARGGGAKSFSPLDKKRLQRLDES